MSYWVFHDKQLDEALEEWSESLNEGAVNPQARELHARFVREFLNSEPVKERGMKRLLEGERDG